MQRLLHFDETALLGTRGRALQLLERNYTKWYRNEEKFWHGKMRGGGRRTLALLEGSALSVILSNALDESLATLALAHVLNANMNTLAENAVADLI